MRRVIALVDCDCFYVSCERKDNPDLSSKPVCVMTGGGEKGIIVSRSTEAKALGVQMGAPYFQIKPSYPQVICLPARMSRYAEISEEVMSVIRAFSPDVEVVSIDEAYIDLTGLDKVLKKSYIRMMADLRRLIWQKTHIPVSIGLSSSKVLAKLASDEAKKNNGIYAISQDSVLKQVGGLNIAQVCGVGRQNAAHMGFYGIFTVKDFLMQDNAFIRKAFGINGLKLKFELSGVLTSKVESEIKAPKSIQDTASFEDFSNNFDFLHSMVSDHVHQASQKLRRWNGYAGVLSVMLRTKEFRIYQTCFEFETPTNSEFALREAAHRLLNRLYRSKFFYRSAGVSLSKLTYGGQEQLSLFENLKNQDDELSRVWDRLEQKYGSAVIRR